MSRPRIVENERGFGRNDAAKIRETFQDKPWEWEEELRGGWPHELREIGVAMAVMYRSDKWKKKGNFESYKHICEAKRPWKLFAVPGFEDDDLKLSGDTTKLDPKTMPSTIADLALFLGLQCRLFVPAGNGYELSVPYEMSIPRAKLMAGKAKSGELFLCVYVKSEGPKLILFGEELDVEKDGIVG